MGKEKHTKRQSKQWAKKNTQKDSQNNGQRKTYKKTVKTMGKEKHTKRHLYKDPANTTQYIKKSVDIKLSAHDAFLELPLSGTRK